MTDGKADAARRRGLAVATTTRRLAGGVVFDCDGVLVDTTPCWDEAFLAVARECDLTLAPDQLVLLRGAALTSAARRLARWSHRAVEPGWVSQVLRANLVRTIEAADLVLAEGASELLNELYGSVCLGVASNSPRAVLLHILGGLEITGYFAVAVSAEDVPRPKPAPDPYLAACDALGIAPRSSFAIEDSDVGVRSALAAGLTVIELTGSPESDSDGRPGPASSLRVGSLADPQIGQLLRSAQLFIPH